MRTTGLTTPHGDHREYSAHFSIPIDSDPFCLDHVAQSRPSPSRAVLTEILADRLVALTGALLDPQPTKGVLLPTKS